MKEKVTEIFKHPVIIPLITGVVAFGAGFYLGRRRRVEEEGADQISSQPENKVIIPGPLVIEAENYLNIKHGIQTTEMIIDDPVEVEVVTSEEIPFADNFTNAEDVWDYKEEVLKRSPDHPYIIHKDEFWSEESGYTQSTLTYYNGDDILCNEDDSPIYNYVQVVGELRFGHGSGDPNVVHVRNDKRKDEYEIVFDPGFYSVEVLGLEIEPNERKGLKHGIDRKFKLE